MLPDYKLYATLIDGFAWYKKSEVEDAKQEFLDRVNRVQKDPTDAMLRGIRFNELVDAVAGGAPLREEVVMVHDTKCPASIVRRFVDGFEGAARQVYVETLLPTIHGNVLVYGFIDEMLADTAYEIKTTGKYEFPKYLHNWQHPVYLECLKAQGANVGRFIYRATDFKDIFEEEYRYRQEDTDRLISECAQLVEFLETNRSEITNKKVFALA